MKIKCFVSFSLLTKKKVYTKTMPWYYVTKYSKKNKKTKANEINNANR